MAKILFLHGLESSPGGTKPTLLAKQGHEVLNPALPKESLADSMRIAQASFDRGRPEVVVGSSRGGALAMAIDSGTAQLVLIAPAWRFCDIPPSLKPGSIILHSPSDEVVPVADSDELIAANPGSRLIKVGEGHRMNDAEALAALASAVGATR